MAKKKEIVKPAAVKPETTPVTAAAVTPAPKKKTKAAAATPVEAPVTEPVVESAPVPAKKPAAKKAPTAKAPAPKAPAAKKEPAAPKFTTDDISLRAYFIAEHRQNHGIHGDSHSDWVEAERQLHAEHSKPKKAAKKKA